MAAQGEILEQTRNLLWRPTQGHVILSDVLAEVADEFEEVWWRKTDFDGAMTHDFGHPSISYKTEIPIGLRPWLANYGVVLVDDLLRERNARTKGLAESEDNHPDVNEEIRQSGKAVIAVVNRAPRDEVSTQDGANGKDFYLAVTDTGLEVYVTPLEFLDGLESRSRIVGLYRLPNEGHPAFNGDKEPFRSARIRNTRKHPNHLEPIFEYTNRAEVLEAKQNGLHPDIIPLDQRAGRIGFVCHFGIVKIELLDMSDFNRLKEGDAARLEINTTSDSSTFEVIKSSDLAASPLKQLAIYSNCSDQRDPGSTTGFIDLAARVDDDPTLSRDTAYFQLLERLKDLDPRTAEVRLVV